MRAPPNGGWLWVAVLFRALAGARGYAADRETNVSTSYGYLTVWEFGEEKAKEVALAFHGGIRKEEILHEWDHVARSLAESGQYKVLVPSFFSNTRLEPGRLHTESSVSLVGQLMSRFAQDRPISLLLGKSWGGAVAARLAAAKPEYVSRLVLVAPGRLVGLSAPIGCRTMLFWAKDDKVVPFAAAKSARRALTNEVAFYAPPAGGHFVRKSYAEAVLAFALDAESLPDLNGWRVRAKDGGLEGGSEPEDADAPPPEDDTAGRQQMLLIAIFSIIAVASCCLIALGVFRAVTWWEDTGRYLVRHLKPPDARARRVGAANEESELDFDPWE